MAFVTLAPLPRHAAPARSLCAPTRMSASGRPRAVSRRAVLSAAAAAVAAAGAGAVPSARAEPSSGVQGAVARFFFPKEGYNVPEATTKSKVTVDREILDTPEAQKALDMLKGYRETVLKASSDFEAAPATYNIATTFKAGFKIEELRDSLNTVNEAFDEDTQRQTDKVVRGIIQDIGEIIYNGGVKEGFQRTPKKIDRIRQWLSKMGGDFDFILGLYG